MQVVFSITHPTAHPAVKWVPSLYNARVDKNTEVWAPEVPPGPLLVRMLRIPGIHIILTSGGPGRTSGAHTTNTGTTVSTPASTWPGFRSLFCAGP